MKYFKKLLLIILLSVINVCFGAEETPQEEKKALGDFINCVQEVSDDKEYQLICSYLLRPDRWQNVIRSSHDLVTVSQACTNRQSSIRLVEYFIYLCTLPTFQLEIRKIIATPKDVQLMCDEFKNPTHVALLRDQYRRFYE